MGGTSTDVCLIRGGVAGARDRARGRRAAACACRMLDIHTVGAGGGSIAWLDAGGALRVGPASAGADPGPACYGRGGTRPTVTDANLRARPARPPRRRWPAGCALDRRGRRRAMAAVARAASPPRARPREGIVAVANAEMVRRDRAWSASSRGTTRASSSWSPFGGAGPLHALRAWPTRWACARILVPAAGGVLSALGIAGCERRRDGVRGVVRPLASAVGGASARGRAASCRASAARGARRRAELRYRGQAFELTVAAASRRGAAPAASTPAHRERYGFDDPDGEIEWSSVRTSVVAPRRRRSRLARARGDAGGARAGARCRWTGATLWVGAGLDGAARPPDGLEGRAMIDPARCR